MRQSGELRNAHGFADKSNVKRLTFLASVPRSPPVWHCSYFKISSAGGQLQARPPALAGYHGKKHWWTRTATRVVGDWIRAP